MIHEMVIIRNDEVYKDPKLSYDILPMKVNDINIFLYSLRRGRDMQRNS